MGVASSRASSRFSPLGNCIVLLYPGWALATQDPCSPHVPQRGWPVAKHASLLPPAPRGPPSPVPQASQGATPLSLLELSCMRHLTLSAASHPHVGNSQRCEPSCGCVWVCVGVTSHAFQPWVKSEQGTHGPNLYNVRAVKGFVYSVIHLLNLCHPSHYPKRLWAACNAIKSYKSINKK